MKTKTGWIFNSAVLLFFMVFAVGLSAANLPSSTSGDYTGGSYGCRILLQGVRDTGQRGVELKCTLPNNEQSSGLTIGPQSCPNEWYIVPLSQWGGSEANKSKLQQISYITPDGAIHTSYGVGILDKVPAKWARIISYDSQSVRVLVGSLQELISGGGELVIWAKREEVALSQPYTGCGPTSFTKPRVRVFGP